MDYIVWSLPSFWRGVQICRSIDSAPEGPVIALKVLTMQVQLKVFLSGARLHHLQLEEGHAKRVRQGEEAEGAHQGIGCPVS